MVTDPRSYQGICSGLRLPPPDGPSIARGAKGKEKEEDFLGPMRTSVLDNVESAYSVLSSRLDGRRPPAARSTPRPRPRASSCNFIGAGCLRDLRQRVRFSRETGDTITKVSRG